MELFNVLTVVVDTGTYKDNKIVQNFTYTQCMKQNWGNWSEIRGLYQSQCLLMFNIVWQSFTTERKMRKTGQWIYRQYLLQLYHCSVHKSFPTLCDPMDCSTPGIPVLHYLLQFAQTHVIELMMSSNHLILCCPLLLPSIFSSIKVFTSESVLRIRWPEYWSFRFSISLSNEYSGLISFRIDWFDLLAVQGTLKSLLQHHCLQFQVDRTI